MLERAAQNLEIWYKKKQIEKFKGKTTTAQIEQVLCMYSSTKWEKS